MEIQVHVGSKLTEEQESKLNAAYVAVKILQAAGYRARVVRLVTFSETDRPAHIILE